MQAALTAKPVSRWFLKRLAQAAVAQAVNMKRITGFPTRPNMVKQLLNVGFDYYNLPSSDGSHYWSDNGVWIYPVAEIDRIEDATNELHAMCMDFVADEVKQGDYAHYRFTDYRKIWLNKHGLKTYRTYMVVLIFGYDGENLKMFEYNADTPTSCLKLPWCNGNG